MPTGARRRRPVDIQRISAAVQRPGIDPRTWVSGARVDTQAESVRWMGAYGWVVEVTFYGGGLDGEPENPCRVLGTGPTGDGFGEYIPPTLGAEVLVGIPDGAAESGVVLGTVRNAADCRPPTAIHGVPIDGERLASLRGAWVSPWDTEIKRSPHSRREHYDGDLVAQAQAVTVVSEQIRLGSEAPVAGLDSAEAALLGESTNQNLETLLTGLDTMASAFSAMTGPLLPFQAVGTALTAVLQGVRANLPATLSKVVKLD